MKISHITPEIVKPFFREVLPEARLEIFPGIVTSNRPLNWVHLNLYWLERGSTSTHNVPFAHLSLSSPRTREDWVELSIEGVWTPPHRRDFAFGPTVVTASRNLLHQYSPKHEATSMTLTSGKIQGERLGNIVWPQCGFVIDPDKPGNYATMSHYLECFKAWGKSEFVGGPSEELNLFNAQADQCKSILDILNVTIANRAIGRDFAVSWQAPKWRGIFYVNRDEFQSNHAQLDAYLERKQKQAEIKRQEPLNIALEALKSGNTQSLIDEALKNILYYARTDDHNLLSQLQHIATATPSLKTPIAETLNLIVNS